jgi:hypothetical protein
VVAAAEDYGIAIKKDGGKNKTIKELCAEMELLIEQQPQRSSNLRPKTRTPSPVLGAVGPVIGMARPPTPPIIDDVPEGIVPRAVVYALTNINETMRKIDLLKQKVVSKAKLVRYAEEFGIKGKSLTKEVLLNRIIAAQIARHMPVVDRAIDEESLAISDEITDGVLDRVEASREQLPSNEDIQTVVKQRISTGEDVTPISVADEIVSENRMSSRSRRDHRISYRSSSSRPSSSSFVSTRGSSADSFLSSRSMSDSVRSSIASSISIADSISSKVAEDILNEVVDKTENSSVKRVIGEVIAQDSTLNIKPDILEEIVSDEQAREAVKSVVSRAADKGLVSEGERDDILQPLRDDAIAGPSGLTKKSTGARPKERISTKTPASQRAPIRRHIKGEQDIENLLREIQKPEKSISNMPMIQTKVFRCLGLIN